LSTEVGLPTVSVVLPTYNRRVALEDTFPLLLELRGIAEIIVVDDASTDGTSDFVESIDDARISVIRHDVRRGAPAARNTGVAAARSDWVLFGEDDCVMPLDYATVLLTEAKRFNAQLISGPWLHCEEGTEVDAIERARATARPKIGLRTHPSTMPEGGHLETPFLTARALVRRDVFERVAFYEGYDGNAYREETDFFVSAARSGFRCIFTSATTVFQYQIWGGGQKKKRLTYERSALRNNWRFLRRHGYWLRQEGHIRPVVLEQLIFATDRARKMVTGYVRARASQLG
jgi:glycosyltransferase involved in cell wall biosynthesis